MSAVFNFAEVSNDFEKKIEVLREDKSFDLNLIELIFKKFGVSLQDRKILQPAWTFENLNQNQKSDLATFQNNLLCFRDKFSSFIQCVSEYNSIPPLIQSILKEFHKKSVQVIKKMCENLLEQMRWKDPRLDPTESVDERIIEELFSGNINESLKVVPSRELACQLGISDQKLRREIYSARQRAILMKGENADGGMIGKNKKGKNKITSSPSDSRASSKTAVSVSDEDAAESYFSDFYARDIPTCASPPSSTTQAQSDAEEIGSDNEDEDMEMMSVVSIFETSDLSPESKVTIIAEVNEVDGWLNIEAWLKSDLFEKDEK